MKRTRHTPEQIIRKLREADQSLVENILFTEVMRHIRGFGSDVSSVA